MLIEPIDIFPEQLRREERGHRALRHRFASAKSSEEGVAEGNPETAISVSLAFLRRQTTFCEKFAHRNSRNREGAS